MLELIMIALASIGIAVTVVWLYRRLTESRGVAASLVSLSEDRGALRLTAQQGFVRLNSETTGDRRRGRRPSAAVARTVVRTRNVGVRKPWGW